MKGKISVEYTVWCGQCPVWNFVGTDTKKIAATRAKRAGWKHTKDGWLCKDCCKGEGPTTAYYDVLKASNGENPWSVVYKDESVQALMDAVSGYIRFNSFGGKFCVNCDTPYPEHKDKCSSKGMADALQTLSDETRSWWSK